MRIRSVSSPTTTTGLGESAARPRAADAAGAAASTGQTGRRASGQSDSGQSVARQSAGAARASLLENARAALTGTATARLIKRVFGVKLGKLGVRYTSQDLEIDPQEVARKTAEREQKRLAREFSSELDVADNQQALADAIVDDALALPAEDAPPVVPTGPMSWLKKLALSLYSRNAKPASEDQTASKFVAVA